MAFLFYIYLTINYWNFIQMIMLGFWGLFVSLINLKYITNASFRSTIDFPGPVEFFVGGVAQLVFVSLKMSYSIVGRVKNIRSSFEYLWATSCVPSVMYRTRPISLVRLSQVSRLPIVFAGQSKYESWECLLTEKIQWMQYFCICICY